MGKYSKIGKALCLLLFSLFLMEYLEPSAVGVRAYVDFPLTRENPEREIPPVTHEMGFSGPSELMTVLLVRPVFSLPSIYSQQSVFFPIFRPPISLRCHL